MISTILLLLVYTIVIIITSPLRLFADVSPLSGLAQAIAQANNYIGTGYRLLPHMVETLLFTWGAFLVFEGFIFAFKGLMWGLKKIPGIK